MEFNEQVEKYDKEIRQITQCIGWDFCECNNCKLAQLYVKNPNYQDFILKINNKLRKNLRGKD